MSQNINPNNFNLKTISEIFIQESEGYWLTVSMA